MHTRQNRCPHSVCTGFLIASKQMGHSCPFSSGSTNLASYPTIFSREIRENDICKEICNSCMPQTVGETCDKHPQTQNTHAIIYPCTCAPHINAHQHICMNIQHAYTNTCTCVHTRAPVLMLACIKIHTQHMHTYLHTHVSCANMHALTHIHMHIITCAHTQLHSSTHVLSRSYSAHDTMLILHKHIHTHTHIHVNANSVNSHTSSILYSTHMHASIQYNTHAHAITCIHTCAHMLYTSTSMYTMYTPLHTLGCTTHTPVHMQAGTHATCLQAYI